MKQLQRTHGTVKRIRKSNILIIEDLSTAVVLKPVLGPPTTAYFVCLPHLTHLIQVISSSVESARLEMGVAYERDIQNVWWLGVPRTGLRTTALQRVECL